MVEPILRVPPLHDPGIVDFIMRVAAMNGLPPPCSKCFKRKRGTDSDEEIPKKKAMASTGTSTSNETAKDALIYRLLSDNARKQMQITALQRRCEESNFKLTIALYSHRETANMALHNHPSNVPIAVETLEKIEAELESLRTDNSSEGVEPLLASDSDSSRCSTPMAMMEKEEEEEEEEEEENTPTDST